MSSEADATSTPAEATLREEEEEGEEDDEAAMMIYELINMIIDIDRVSHIFAIALVWRGMTQTEKKFKKMARQSCLFVPQFDDHANERRA